MIQAMKKQTPRVEQVITRAERIADGYGDDYIGTEHLLLSIVRDEGGIASHVLRELGVRDEVETRLRSVLEAPDYNPERRGEP
jgi:ATP-dependent Clp protease ATP-binding subunit ClpA